MMVINLALIDEKMLFQIKSQLGELRDPVRVLFFKPKNFEYENEINMLANNIKLINPKLTMAVLIFGENKKLEKEYGIDKAPAFILEGKDKRVARFFGLPIGGEFSTFLLDIKDLSLGGPELSQDIAKRVKEIDFPVHLQVFVTPTCSFCPQVGKLAHDLAMLNDKVKADMIDANIFSDLSNKYNVSAVPKTIINDKIEILGAMPPEYFLKKILELKK